MNMVTAIDRALQALTDTVEDPSSGSDPDVVALAHLRALRMSMPADAPMHFWKSLSELADDLLEAHEDTGISLDAWVPARHFVEAYCGPIVENGA